MAINKVIYGNNTLIDISDTTATANDVATGKDIYLADGTKATGVASLLTNVIWKEPVNLTFSDSYALADCLSYVEAVNYPFFKLVGFTRRRTAGDYTGNNYVYFYTTNTNIPNISATYGVLNNRQLVASSGSYPNNLSVSVDTVLDTSTSGYEGKLRLRYNRINSNYRQYYGDDFIYWIDKNRCDPNSIFYTLPYVRSSMSL